MTSDYRLQIIKGILFIMLGVYLAVCLFSYNKWDSSFLVYSKLPVKNYGGTVGAYISDILMSLFGYSSFLIVIMCVVYGYKRLTKREKNLFNMLGAFALILSISIFAHLVNVRLFNNSELFGGALGFYIVKFGIPLVSYVGMWLIALFIFVSAVIIISPVFSFSNLFVKTEKFTHSKDLDDSVNKNDYSDIKITEPGFNVVQPISEPSMQEENQTKIIKGYTLPSSAMLKKADENIFVSKEELTLTASLLEGKMQDFKVDGKIRQAHPGPVVTMYEFEPAAGVKINRIVSLTDDLALSLKAPSIRIYPISGKATLGIEVPNKVRATVTLREIVESESFIKSKSLLTLALGKDIFGNPISVDLARMPHLLVAGATGSGKSVSINAMILSLLFKASPREVKMLMIDPKLLELSSYADIPHLISPVITNPKESSDALKKVVYEMEQRYKLLAEKGARNIENYNNQVAEDDRLPYIVVFIDELADLMLTAPSDVENAIARLAQMARASGIHLILATQRPSVDVITGLIKANFPARISFQVTSRIDSRTILDAQGAEQLLGKGDMLYMAPGAKMMRIHGAFVGDEEVKAVVDFIKSQGISPDYTAFDSIVLIQEDKGKATKDDNMGDELYEQVYAFASSTGEISISSIQRKFRIGYNRAAYIMDLFEQQGLIGPPKGAGKPRDFLGR